MEVVVVVAVVVVVVVVVVVGVILVETFESVEKPFYIKQKLTFCAVLPYLRKFGDIYRVC